MEPPRLQNSIRGERAALRKLRQLNCGTGNTGRRHKSRQRLSASRPSRDVSADARSQPAEADWTALADGAPI